ncbi:MAG TPA: hypothetical protein VFV27_09330 [Nevskiaceae bacterium]|nr:hypothetical protein [Nevskiaceae bacterium]
MMPPISPRPLCVLLSLLLLAACSAPPPPAPPPPAAAEAAGTGPEWPAEVAAYQAEYARVQAASAPVSLEPLFAAAEAAQGALMKIEGEQAWIERLDEPAYERLRAALPGLVLSRGVEIYAQPDPDALLALAERQGGEADRAFFRLHRAYWSADLVPRYVRLRADYATPCLEYGQGELVRLYQTWSDFQRVHPQAYPAFAGQIVADMEEAITLGTCTCNDVAGVLAEQQQWLTALPDSSVAERVRARMQQLQTDPDAQPVWCR